MPGNMGRNEHGIKICIMWQNLTAVNEPNREAQIITDVLNLWNTNLGQIISQAHVCVAVVPSRKLMGCSLWVEDESLPEERTTSGSLEHEVGRRIGATGVDLRSYPHLWPRAKRTKAWIQADQMGFLVRSLVICRKSVVGPRGLVTCSCEED